MKLVLIAQVFRTASAREAFLNYFEKDSRFAIYRDEEENDYAAYVKESMSSFTRKLWLGADNQMFYALGIQRTKKGLLETALEEELQAKIDDFNNGSLEILPEIADLVYELRKPTKTKEYKVGSSFVRLEEVNLQAIRDSYAKYGVISIFLHNYIAISSRPEEEKALTYNLKEGWFKSEELKADLGLGVDVWMGIWP